MDKKTYFLTVALVFSAIGIMHALRLWFAWEGIIGGWMVPQWLSWVAVIVALVLAWQGFSFSKRR